MTFCKRLVMEEEDEEDTAETERWEEEKKKKEREKRNKPDNEGFSARNMCPLVPFGTSLFTCPVAHREKLRRRGRWSLCAVCRSGNPTRVTRPKVASLHHLATGRLAVSH